MNSFTFDSNSQVVIYCSEVSPRLIYTLDVLFRIIAKVDYELTAEKHYYLNANGPKICYHHSSVSEGEVIIPKSRFLFETGIVQQPIAVFRYKGLPTFFRCSDRDADISFDLFAAAFFLLTRYEEYLPFRIDEHGRFPAKESLAYRGEFLEKPIIDIWMSKLKKCVCSKFPRFEFPAIEYRFQPTYDIDIAWAYKGKSFWRQAGGTIQEVLKADFQALTKRVGVALNLQRDPFDVFDFLMDLHKGGERAPIFFFLLGKYGTFDKNISSRNRAYRMLINAIAQKYEVGIHPSYASNEQEGFLRAEKNRLENIIGRPIIRSRQHYLKLRFPDTYLTLLQQGVRHDYTMGFADSIGFRAGTSHAFPWYSLREERTRDLIIHPFQLMDVTLKRNYQLNPSEILDKAASIVEEIKNYGGTFSTIWHNSSFSFIGNWRNWKEIYESIINIAVSNNNRLW